jgi:hypothetical protein
MRAYSSRHGDAAPALRRTGPQGPQNRGDFKMHVSQWMDRFANTAVIAVLLAGLPMALFGFVTHSM